MKTTIDKIGRTKYRMQRFSSVDDLITYTKNSTAPVDQSSYNIGAYMGGSEYFSLHDFDSFQTTMRTRWEEGASLYKKEAKTADITAPAPVAETFEQVASITGDSVDIGAFLEGVPECMYDYEIAEVEGAGTVLTLALSSSVSWQTKPRQMARHGIAMAILVDALEANGYRVNLIRATHISCPPQFGAQHLIQVVPVKSAHEPLDIDRIIKTCILPDFERRGTWRSRETLYHQLRTDGDPHTYNDADGSYGSVLGLTQDGVQDLLQTDAILHGVDWNRQASVSTHLQKMIEDVEKQLGIKVDLGTK